jgi:cell division cycle 20, cofactor of APC complex
MARRELFTFNSDAGEGIPRGMTSTPPISSSINRKISMTSPSLVSVLGSSARRSISRSRRSSSVPFIPSPRRLEVAMDLRPRSPKKHQGVKGEFNSPTKTRTGAHETSNRSYLNTPPRIDSCSRAGQSRTPSRSQCDRFIPNRSHMRIELSRANLFSAEKSRIVAMEKKVSQPLEQTEQNDSNNSTVSNSEILTPIQAEYRSRVRGSLLNISADEMNGNNVSLSTSLRSVTSLDSEMNHSTPTGFNAVIPSFPSDDYDENLVYANIPTDHETGNTENIDPYGRVLSFRSNLEETSFSSLDSSMTTPSQSQRVIDPYTFNNLRVFDNSGDRAFDERSGGGFNGSSTIKATRKINAAPTRILDAPELVDDYYLNLISWGKDNVLAVALGQCVYLWNATTGDIHHLLTLSGQEDFVTSVRWADMSGHTNYLAVGTNDGPVQIWDTSANKKVRTLGGHTARVGSLAWNQHMLSSGGRDSIIVQHDVRSASHIVSNYIGHTQEVCGLEWNDDGTTLASGGNENYLCIWDAAMSMRRSGNTRGDLTNTSRQSPRLTLTQHQAAVKALAWCPFHRGQLASGGGTADRTIKFWNSNSGAVLNSIDTGSQVCSLLWSKHNKELCSSHGFSENQLILWRYPNMTKIQEFKGHTARVLHMEQSPDGASVVSAAADETLRFWDVFGSPPSKRDHDLLSFSSLGRFAGPASILR